MHHAVAIALCLLLAAPVRAQTAAAQPPVASPKAGPAAAAAPAASPSTPPPPAAPAASGPAPTEPAAPAPAPTPAAAARVVTASRDGMGTRFSISVYSADEKLAQEAIGAAFTELERIDNLLSEWRANSDIARLNRAAGKDAVPIAPETLGILELGKDVSKKSSGAFALSWAALASVWDFSSGAPAKLPDAGAAREKAQLVNDEEIILDKNAKTAKLARVGMALGVGGIGKGWAAERAYEKLRERGLSDALIAIGGDILVRGKKGDKPWLVGIQDPRAVGYFATLPMADEAISTSGDYQRYFEVDGKRYHHILDPRTGMPATGSRSITVVGKSAALVDALATAAFVLGPQKGLELIESAGCEGLVVDEQNNVTMSKGLRDRTRVLRAPTP